MVLSRLKAIAVAIVMIPIGLLYILGGVVNLAFWYLPAKLGVGIAAEAFAVGQQQIAKGTKLAIPS